MNLTQVPTEEKARPDHVAMCFVQLGKELMYAPFDGDKGKKAHEMALKAFSRAYDLLEESANPPIKNQVK